MSHCTSGCKCNKCLPGKTGCKGIDGPLGPFGPSGQTGPQGIIGDTEPCAIPVTYSELLQLVTDSNLNPGCNYLITDFRTLEHIPGTVDSFSSMGLLVGPDFGGSGYTPNITSTGVTFIGGSGLRAEATVTTNSIGSIISLIFTIPGSGYNFGEILTVDPTSGSPVIGIPIVSARIMISKANWISGPIEPIIVQAISNNQIDETNVLSTVYPEDILYYEILNTTTSKDDRGRIYYREDTINKLSTWYDWRVVKFRRWSTFMSFGFSGAFANFVDGDQIISSHGGTALLIAIQGSVATKISGLFAHTIVYNSLVTNFVIGEGVVGVTSGAYGEIRVDTGSILKVNNDGGSITSFLPGETIVGQISLATATVSSFTKETISNIYGETAIVPSINLIPNNYFFLNPIDNGTDLFYDFPTFASNIPNPNIDTKIGPITSIGIAQGAPSDKLNNIIFEGSAIRTNIGSESYNNTFGSVSPYDFNLGGFADVILGEFCHDNILGEGNNISINIKIGNHCNNNQIVTPPQNFNNNIIGDNFSNNITYSMPGFNNVNSGFYNNVIGNNCIGNTIQQGTFLIDYNIGNNFINNTFVGIAAGRVSIIGDNCRDNYFGVRTPSNITNDAFLRVNKIENNFCGIPGIVILVYTNLSAGVPFTVGQAIQALPSGAMGTIIQSSVEATIGSVTIQVTSGTFLNADIITNGSISAMIRYVVYGNLISGSFAGNSIANDFKSNCINFPIGQGFNDNKILNGFNTNLIGGHLLTANDIYHLGSPGSFYTPGTHFNVIVTGGTGTGMLATVIVNSIGNVYRIDITSQGSGYESFYANYSLQPASGTPPLGLPGNPASFSVGESVFRKNTIESNLLASGSPYGVDFKLATHVYGDYSCEIFENTSQNYKLSYNDPIDTLITTQPNA